MDGCILNVSISFLAMILIITLTIIMASMVRTPTYTFVEFMYATHIQTCYPTTGGGSSNTKLSKIYGDLLVPVSSR